MGTVSGLLARNQAPDAACLAERPGPRTIQYMAAVFRARYGTQAKLLVWSSKEPINGVPRASSCATSDITQLDDPKARHRNFPGSMAEMGGEAFERPLTQDLWGVCTDWASLPGLLSKGTSHKTLQ